jgi:hypothetical protein
MSKSSKEKSSSMESIDFIRAGRSILVRKLVKGQYVELGRYDELEDALLSFRTLAPSFFVQCDVVESDTGSINSQSSADEDEEEELWCAYCFDDPQVRLCAFCGCRKCFGKHYSHCLLLCDECDQETHTFCLSPPLQQVPKGSWYCDSCAFKQSEKQAADDAMAEDEEQDKAMEPEDSDAKSLVDDEDDDEEEPEIDVMEVDASEQMYEDQPHVLRNKRGRPKGSLGKSRASSRGRPSVSQKKPKLTKSPHSAEPAVAIVIAPSSSSTATTTRISTARKVGVSPFLINGAMSSPMASNLNSDLQTQSQVECEDPHKGVINLQSAMAIVNAMRSRKLSVKEKEILGAFRETASTSDLKIVLAALMAERDLIKPSTTTIAS